MWFSLTFPVCSKFPDFSCGKCLLIFPGFPVGTLTEGVYLPGGCTCLGVVPARGVPAQVLPPPLWTEWQTGAKILPCPKLRLRAVKTSVHSHSCFKVFLKLFQFSGSSTCGNFGFNISCSWSWRLDIGLATRKVLIIKDNRQRSLICFHNSLSWF